MWYWSADIFWQVPIDHNRDVQYQRWRMLKTGRACICQLISWSMAEIFCDSAVIVIVISMSPLAIPPAMKTMRKSIHGFPFLSYMGMGLWLAALWATAALLFKVNYHNNILIFCLKNHHTEIALVNIYGWLLAINCVNLHLFVAQHTKQKYIQKQKKYHKTNMSKTSLNVHLLH